MRIKVLCASNIVKRSFSEHNKEETKPRKEKGTQDKSKHNNHDHNLNNLIFGRTFRELINR